MSSAKNGSGKPGRPPDEGESLDFTESVEQRPLPAGAPPRPKPKPKPKAAAQKAPPPKPRRAVSPALVIVSVAALVAGYFLFGMPAAEKPVKPAISKKAPSASAPAPASAETSESQSKPLPPVVIESPPEIPAAFLKAFETYRSSPNSKAIALALDRNGWAYAAVANAGSQATANVEALSDCAKRRGAAIKAECRLYAEGDNVVW